MKETAGKAKRGSKAHALVRGEPVVRGVLDATLQELARVGYGALRIEDVAARASVNKTTIYRRWPTKEDLVRAALVAPACIEMRAPETGSLRGDLLAVARSIVELTLSPEGQCLMRILLAEGIDSELMAIALSLRKSYESIPRAILQAAEARGELAPGIDAMLVFEALAATLSRMLFIDRKSVDEATLGRLVDLLLHGALSQKARKRA